MGITAWIALGLATGLLANMLLPGKRSRALIFICLTCFMLILGGLGLVHARRVSPAAEILGGHPAHARTPDPASAPADQA